MKVFLKYIPLLLAAAVFSGFSAPDAGDISRHPGKIDMDGLFLESLQQRDSVLIADQLEYGFVLDGITEGTALAFPDYSDGFCEGVELVSGWKVDTLDLR